MLKLVAVFVPLLVVGVWAAPPSNNGNSTSDFNKIHIVIELRKNPLNSSAPEEVIVYQEVEDSREVTTPMAVTTPAAKPSRPATTSAPASSTPMSSLLAFDSSEEVVRRPFPTFSPERFPRYRPTISVPPKGPKLLLMGNRPTVDFLKRHFPKAQVATPITPSHNVVVRNARRTANSALAESAGKKPTFEVVGTYKDGTLHTL